MKRRITFLCALLSPFSGLALAGTHPQHDHSHDSSPPSYTDRGLLEPFEHTHFSRLGSPIVHSFGIEPALTGRDLFTHYRYREGHDVTEQEIELELEWAFTRALGIILEVPYIFERERGESTIDGFGDLAVVPRAVLLERDRFILTAQAEIVIPTGADHFTGDTILAPGIATWTDLGNWWTLNSQLALEHVLDADETELVFGFGLIKTLGRAEEPAGDAHAHGHAARLFNLHLEATGTVGVHGDEQGVVQAEGLLGISWTVNAGLDFRLGYEFPLTSPHDFDRGFVTGFVVHF